MVNFESKQIALIGDLMLDAYTFGNVERISPEAPVPILHVTSESNQPGGVGNVALNLAALGSKVRLMGRIGPDSSGEILIKELQDYKICCKSVISQSDFLTPRKNRLIAGNQQMARVDHEVIMPINHALENALIHSLPNFLSGVGAVALSDYGKGVLTPNLIQAVIHASKVPVIVDPKGTDFSIYRGACVIKPNLKEAYGASGLTHSHSLEQVAEKLLTITQCKALVITRSEKGISLFRPNAEAKFFPAKNREVKDVTGAGDTVLATISVALANGFSIEEAIALANIAAGIAVEGLGCQHVTLDQMNAVYSSK
ncbi:MAG: D-glycero-beta-D-manno-heptose-7-phosphate kinase [Waddliaceae bacterium]